MYSLVETMREIEILVEVKFKKEGNSLRQIFSIKPQNRKTDIRFVKDNRFFLHRLFENSLYKYVIYRNGCVFVDRLDYPYEVIFSYEITSEEKFDDFFFKLNDTVPDGTGCDYCKHSFIDNMGLYYCAFLNKSLTKPKKTCKFFRQNVIM
jgi:hypothetical protein